MLKLLHLIKITNLRDKKINYLHVIVECLQYHFYYDVEVIREKGLEKVTVDMLVTEITPKARCKFI